MSLILIIGKLVGILMVIACSEGYKIIWDNDAEVDLNEIDDEFARLGKRPVPNWFFIFPGTKWCGAGNISEHDEDLGVERDTDKCCRTHDMCPEIIEGHGTRYGLENPSFFTRLHCDCDEAFYKCLKSVNTKTSTQIGHIYFSGLGTQCYKKEYPIAGCKKYTTFLRRKCLDYIYNEGLPMKYQWFDIRNF